MNTQIVRVGIGQEVTKGAIGQHRLDLPQEGRHVPGQEGQAPSGVFCRAPEGLLRQHLAVPLASALEGRCVDVDAVQLSVQLRGRLLASWVSPPSLAGLPDRSGDDVSV